MINRNFSSVDDFGRAARRAAEEKRESDDRATVWAFIWTLFGFKLATAVAIFWAAGWTGEAGTILAATHWFWLFLPTFVVAGPLLFHLRLRKVRRKRDALRRSEWMID